MVTMLTNIFSEHTEGTDKICNKNISFTRKLDDKYQIKLAARMYL